MYQYDRPKCHNYRPFYAWLKQLTRPTAELFVFLGQARLANGPYHL